MGEVRPLRDKSQEAAPFLYSNEQLAKMGNGYVKQNPDEIKVMIKEKLGVAWEEVKQR